jgi:release factor glutamine methyltransferase
LSVHAGFAAIGAAQTDATAMTATHAGGFVPLRVALVEAEAALAVAGVESPRREARLLAAFALGTTAAELALARPDTAVPAVAFRDSVARRARREPFAFITGRRGFWDFELAVSAATLIPRPESETLIEAARAAFADAGQVQRVLDLGCGTGCLLLAALRVFPGAFGVGIDLAPDAASLAARNAADLGLAGRAAFLAGDWASPVAGRFDLILCNPPYIPDGHIAGLAPEVAAFEPRRALAGGGEGLDAYISVIPTLSGLLSSAGVAVLELGTGQAAAASEIVRQAGFAAPETRRDLLGIHRALILRPAGEKTFGRAASSG